MEGTKSTPSGLGNQCSVEFNLAYRWHSAISANDEKWTEEIYEELMGKPASEVSMRELLFGLKKYEQEIPKDPSKRTFAGLKRQEDGTFKDEDLVRILSNAIEDVASECNSYKQNSQFTYHCRLFRCTERAQGPEICGNPWY